MDYLPHEESQEVDPNLLRAQMKEHREEHRYFNRQQYQDKVKYNCIGYHRQNDPRICEKPEWQSEVTEGKWLGGNSSNPQILVPECRTLWYYVNRSCVSIIDRLWREEDICDELTKIQLPQISPRPWCSKGKLTIAMIQYTHLQPRCWTTNPAAKGPIGGLQKRLENIRRGFQGLFTQGLLQDCEDLCQLS